MTEENGHLDKVIQEFTKQGNVKRLFLKLRL